MILHWSSRVTRCLFCLCFYLVLRAYLELCYSNLFMFKCHLSGLAKEALRGGCAYWAKMTHPAARCRRSFFHSLRLQRSEHFRSNQRSLVNISAESWPWRVVGMQRCSSSKIFNCQLVSDVKSALIFTEKNAPPLQTWRKTVFHHNCCLFKINYPLAVHNPVQSLAQWVDDMRQIKHHSLGSEEKTTLGP